MRNDRPGPYTSWMTRQGAASEVSARVWERISMTPRKEGSKPYLCRSSAWRRIDVWSRIYRLHSGKSQKRHEEKWIKKYHNYSMCSEILGDVLALYKHFLKHGPTNFEHQPSRGSWRIPIVATKKRSQFSQFPMHLSCFSSKGFCFWSANSTCWPCPEGELRSFIYLANGWWARAIVIAHAMLHNGQWTVSCVADFYDSSFPISSIYASNIQQPFLANLTLWVEIPWAVSATVLSMELRLCIGPSQFRQHRCAAEQGKLQQRWLQLKLRTWVAPNVSSKGLGWRFGRYFWGWNFGEASNHPKPREGLKHLHMKQFHLQHSFLQNVKWLHGLNRPTPKATKIIQDLPCQNHFKTASSGAVVPCSLGLFGPTGSESMEKRTAVQGADVSFVLIKTLLSL